MPWFYFRSIDWVMFVVKCFFVCFWSMAVVLFLVHYCGSIVGAWRWFYFRSNAGVLFLVHFCGFHSSPLLVLYILSIDVGFFLFNYSGSIAGSYFQSIIVVIFLYIAVVLCPVHCWFSTSNILNRFYFLSIAFISCPLLCFYFLSMAVFVRCCSYISCVSMWLNFQSITVVLFPVHGCGSISGPFCDSISGPLLWYYLPSSRSSLLSPILRLQKACRERIMDIGAHLSKTFRNHLFPNFCRELSH